MVLYVLVKDKEPYCHRNSELKWFTAYRGHSVTLSLPVPFTKNAINILFDNMTIVFIWLENYILFSSCKFLNHFLPFYEGLLIVGHKFSICILWFSQLWRTNVMSLREIDNVLYCFNIAFEKKHKILLVFVSANKSKEWLVGWQFYEKFNSS